MDSFGISSSIRYYGGAVLKKFEEDVPLLPEECQQRCWAVTGAVAFTLNDAGKTCTSTTPTFCKSMYKGSNRAQKYGNESLLLFGFSWFFNVFMGGFNYSKMAN